MSMERPGAESAFHQERFERKAERRNASIFAKAGLVEKVTAEDMAHEEALRDLEDFDKRESEEYARWEAMLVPVMDAIKEKLAGNEGSEPVRIGLLALGGGNMGATSVGQLMAMQEMGFRDKGVFAAVGGISGGGGGPAYFATGETEKAAAQFVERCTSKEFLALNTYQNVTMADFTEYGGERFASLSDIQIPARLRFLDIEHPAESIAEGPMSIDQEKVRESPIDTFVVTTDAADFSAHVIDLKTATPDIPTAFLATAAIPLFHGPVEVNGTKYYDGGIGEAPIREIIEKYGLTHLLVLPEQPFGSMSTIKYSKTQNAFIEFTVALKQLFGSLSSGSLGSLSNSMGLFSELSKHVTGVREDALASLQEAETETGAHIGVLYPPDTGVAATTTNRDALKASIYECFRATIERFGGTQPHEISIPEFTAP